nr:organic cation transporter protein-like [Rhipicephalus microplus]
MVMQRWHLVCDRAPYVVMTHVYYTVGELLGAPLVGQLADRAGRRPMVFGALLMSMASVFTATAADSFPAFVVAHVLIALSTSTAHFLTSILLFESSSSAYRALYIAAAETGAPLVHAISLCPWLQHMDLRFTRIALVFSMILLSLAFHAVAESPRWMLAVGDYDALTTVLTSIAQENEFQLGDVWRLVHYAEAVKPLQAGMPFQLSDVLLLPELRTRTVALSVLWFWCFFAEYSILLVRPNAATRTSPLVAMLLLLVPVYATGYPLVVRWPRRTSLHMTLMVASTVGVAAGATHYYESPLVTEVMGLLLAMVQLCLLVAKLHAYECFPSAVRATAVHVVVAAGCLGQGMAQFLVDVARVADATSALLIMSVGLLTCELAIRWLPETKNVELPEVQAEVLSQECHPHQVTPPFKDEVLPARRTSSTQASSSHQASSAGRGGAGRK